MSDGLRAEGLTLTYGNSAVALSNVTIDVPAGKVVAILGANGAGKTSLVRALTGQHGFYGARIAGSVSYAGREIGGLDPPAIARAGIVQVPEGRKLFASLSVRENLLCGAASQRGRSRKQIESGIDEVLAIFPLLRERMRSSAGFLSGGEQQMVAIGRALMARPKVLLCDELSLGLAPLAIRDIYGTLAHLNGESGLSLVVIEQNAHQALRMAHYAYVLEVGMIVAQGPAHELMNSDDVERYYLGGSEAV